MHQRFDEYDASINILHDLKGRCSRLEQHVRKVKVFYLLGMAHSKGRRDHVTAERYFKKTLFYAWTLNSTLGNLNVPANDISTLIYYEMHAYEGLGIQNFYLGQLPKAEYYQDRFLRGKMENDSSVIKGAAIQFVKTHLHKKRGRLEGNGANGKADPSGPKFARLPSPAGQVAKAKGGQKTKLNTKDSNILPHLTEAQAI